MKIIFGHFLNYKGMKRVKNLKGFPPFLFIINHLLNKCIYAI